MPQRRFDFLPRIDPTRCTGCGWCVGACPENLLSLECRDWKKTCSVGDTTACTGCNKCEDRCLFQAITVTRHARSGPLNACP